MADNSLLEICFGLESARENLGVDLPVPVYRMLEYSMRDAIIEECGKDTMIKIFRSAGVKAGTVFANKALDLTLDLDSFFEQLQNTLANLKVGILRVESFDPDTGVAYLAVSEDLDCSGLPVIGETVCNYDEGFIAGILQAYTKKPYVAIEVDCWATGARVCRFKAEIEE